MSLFAAAFFRTMSVRPKSSVMSVGFPTHSRELLSRQRVIKIPMKETGHGGSASG